MVTGGLLMPIAFLVIFSVDGMISTWKTSAWPETFKAVCLHRRLGAGRRWRPVRRSSRIEGDELGGENAGKTVCCYRACNRYRLRTLQTSNPPCRTG